MKFKNIALLTILTITMITGCGEKEKIKDDQLVKPQQDQTTTQNSVEKELPKQQAPVFNLQTHDGKSINITADAKNGWKFSGLENKVVLVDFFGTWCPPCKAEIPHLNNIRVELQKDFEIIGIDIGNRDGSLNTQQSMQNFIDEYDIQYPITITDQNIELFRAVQELNPSGSIPFMILFNKKGEFIQYYVGMKPEEMLKADIQATINMK
ncbi:MAG: TlpA family protein disulfide reductase [Campylobacterales bacterium]|nr:TlpA family protein disulfide reductase [Campylobacterales bacterium]